MKILEKDARHLLLHLGLDAEKISQLNQKFCPQTPEPTQQHVAQPEDLLNERIDSSLGAEDVFASGLHQQSPSPPEQPSPLNDVASISSSLPEIDDTSRRLEVTPTPLHGAV
ncbi:hypothetical protein PINS_up020763 [Pythium insidiosum]|nr:hypothetical protein PINS_up020763 [Pythium insidiosum]